MYFPPEIQWKENGQFSFPVSSSQTVEEDFLQMYKGLNFSWNEMADHRNHHLHQENSYPVWFPSRTSEKYQWCSFLMRLVQNALLLGSCLFAPDDTPTVHWVCPIALIVSIISLEAVPKRLLTLHIVFISLEKLRQLWQKYIATHPITQASKMPIQAVL